MSGEQAQQPRHAGVSTAAMGLPAGHGRRLQGRRALITGAASGIGAAISARFVAEGASLAVLDADRDALDRLVEGLHGDGASIHGFPVDVTDEAAVRDAVGAAAGALHGLDTIVPNAGIQLFGADAPVDELDANVWRHTLDVNLTGVFHTCKHGIAALLDAGGGSVVCTGSPTGLRGSASGFHAYSTSKAGVIGLVRVMAADYASRGVRVNAVIPGFTDTPLVTALTADPESRARTLRRTPMGRPGRSEEVAAVAAFLASDDAAFVTGALYAVDGGETAV